MEHGVKRERVNYSKSIGALRFASVAIFFDDIINLI